MDMDCDTGLDMASNYVMLHKPTVEDVPIVTHHCIIKFSNRF